MTFSQMIEGHEYEIDVFEHYAHQWAETYHSVKNTPAPAEKLLRFWTQNKGDLYKLLGNELILSRDITIAMSADELELQMRDFIDAHTDFISKFRRNLYNDLGLANYYIKDRCEPYDTYLLLSDLFNSASLTEARINVAHTFTLNGKVIKLSPGQKLMKVLGQVADLLDLHDSYEQFRIAHSQILNQKTVKGKLNLSIHPLDYATASDNESNWSSCMSWQDEGCYRLGTVEMMNSPVVLVAYLSSDNVNMELTDDFRWNSKKWRSWIIVSPAIIASNRQYPYTNDNLMNVALDWVKELAKCNCGWEYKKEVTTFESTCPVRFDTFYMYNDYAGNRDCFGYLGTHVALDKKSLYINYSGPANCMWCGSLIPFTSSEHSNTLVCLEDDNYLICESCGERVYEEYALYDNVGTPYCESCYDALFERCICCDEETVVEDMISIAFPRPSRELIIELLPEDSAEYKIYTSHEIGFSCRRYYKVRVCQDCVRGALDGLNFDDVFQHADELNCHIDPFSEANDCYVPKINSSQMVTIICKLMSANYTLFDDLKILDDQIVIPYILESLQNKSAI